MFHWQFQNGYHQYEILEYLGVNNPKSSAAAEAVASLADKEGHFAHYPGGGGCFDYDAVSILTSAGYAQKNKGRNLLLKTATAILSQQNDDGGFADSHRVRPRSIRNIHSAIQHVFSGRDVARKERPSQCLKMMFPKHDRVHTHWSKYSREWSESNLWDSWFRMLTVARIECNISSNARKRWGFIDYPGIGFSRGAGETGKTGNLP